MKIIIDTDGGCDDAMALFYLLRAEKYAKLKNDTHGVEILAITCVNGNTNVNQVIINVFRVLQRVNRLDVPVYKGAETALLVTPPFDPYYGKDGMRDHSVSKSPPKDFIQQEHAVNALIRLVDENPGEITLLALGPLTNIALSIRMNEQFLRKLDKLYIMGGSIAGIGNVMPGVEFNFFIDPEANYIVLNGSKFDDHSVILLPWEPIKNMNSKSEWRKNVLKNLRSTEITFMNKIEYIEDDSKYKASAYADLVLAAIVLNKNLIEKIESHNITALTQGPSRGGIVVDFTDILKSNKKIDIITEVGSEAFIKTILHYFT